MGSEVQDTGVFLLTYPLLSAVALRMKTGGVTGALGRMLSCRAVLETYMYGSPGSAPAPAYALLRCCRDVQT